MKTAFAVLLLCAMYLPACSREKKATDPATATDTPMTMAESSANSVEASSDPVALARDQIQTSMIEERAAARRELVARAQPAGGEALRDWRQFRRVFPYHIQEIAVSRRHGNERTVIVAEPPSGIALEELLEAVGSGLVAYEVRKQPIGYDGWVKDVVLRVSGDDDAFSETVSRLTSVMYGTTYKAHVVPLPGQPGRRGLDLDLDITPAEIKQWLITDGEGFVPVLGGQTMSVDAIAQLQTSRVFFANNPGLVAWWIPASARVDSLRAEIRQFALDSDLIIGAVHRSSGTLILARERGVPVDDLPPLRFETIALLAGVDGDARDQLAQSYERTAPFAGAIGKGQDWAPIYLSPELVDTEYGSLLNITDQLLKGWSTAGRTQYVNFDYPKPEAYPFPKGVRAVLVGDGGGQLTYNWNTTGVGYSVTEGSSEIFALYRTGALPVSYLPDGVKRSDPRVVDAEDRGYDFFAGMRDPNLIRVVQYAALYQIFSAFDVHATAPPKNDTPHELREKIESALLDEISAASDEEREQLAKKLAGRVVQTMVERIGGERQLDVETMRARLVPRMLRDLNLAVKRNAPPMSLALSAYAELKRVPDQLKSDGDKASGWIHTPLVVMSTNVGALQIIGGHNLYADRTRFEISPDVPVGQPEVTKDGLRLHPQDAAKSRELLRVAARDRRAEMTSAEIAEDITATLRRMPEPRAPRERLVALKLAGSGGHGPGKPPRPPFRGRGTDHRGSNGWGMNFGAEPPEPAGFVPGIIHVERQKDRTIRIVFEGGEARAATAEDATDALAQLVKNGSVGQDGIRLELRGFQPEDAQNFVRNCDRRTGAADAEVSALVADGRLNAATAKEILARQYDFGRATVTHGEILVVDGRPHGTIVVDIPRKGTAGSARTDVTLGFHKATPQNVAIQLLGSIRSRIETIAKQQAAKLDAIRFNLRVNAEIKAVSRKTGVPIDIVRQQFVDAQHDLYFVELAPAGVVDEGEDERRGNAS